MNWGQFSVRGFKMCTHAHKLVETGFLFKVTSVLIIVLINKLLQLSRCIHGLNFKLVLNVASPLHHLYIIGVYTEFSEI